MQQSADFRNINAFSTKLYFYFIYIAIYSALLQNIHLNATENMKMESFEWKKNLT